VWCATLQVSEDPDHGHALKQIEYFCAVGGAGSIALASGRLNISSPSVSAAISQLETEFGIGLLVRHHAQGVSLTAEGRRFLEEAKRLIAHSRRIAAR
jgi:DNA-binding transcriptional LysR family regulator